jgi:hypothetical protein
MTAGRVHTGEAGLKASCSADKIKNSSSMQHIASQSQTRRTLTAEPAAVLFPALLLNDIAIAATPTALMLEPAATLELVIFEAAAEKASVSCSS